MTTATGQIVVNFSALPDAAPYTPAGFVASAGFAARIVSGSLRGNLVTGFLRYTAVAPQAGETVSVRGETLRGSDGFNDPSGVGVIDNDGNGYIFWRNGNIGRIYKSTSFVLTQMGSGETLTYDAGAVTEIRCEYDGSGTPTTTLTAVIDGVDTPLVRQDTTAPYSTFIPALYFEHSDSSASGFISVGFDGMAVGPQLVSVNAGQPVRAGQTGIPVVVSAGFTPTSGTIAGIAVTNIQGASPNFTCDLPAVVEGASHPGYGSRPAVFTDGVDSPQLSVSFQPKSGYSFQTIGVAPDRTINGIGYQFDPQLTQNDQIAFPSPAMTVGATGGAPGTSATTGTHQCEHISAVDNIVRFFELRVGA